jgi:hypothetical protein
MKTVFCFIAIFAILLTTSCSLLKPKIDLKKQDFASDTVSSSIMPLNAMYEAIIKAGIGEKIEDFDAVEFSFTISLPNGKPYSNSPVLISFDDIGKLRVGWTSSEGIILLAFSKEMLNKNPKIIVENNPDVLFNTNFTGAIEIGVKMKSVDISTLKRVELLPDAYWLDPLLTKDWNTELVEILRTQREFIKQFLGLEPIPFGIALIETSDNSIISPSEIEVGKSKIRVFPYSVKRDNVTAVTSTNLHEWTELTLQHYYKGQKNLPRFMSDGFAEVIKLEYFKSLDTKTQSLLIPDKKFIANMINNSRKYWDEASKEGIKGFNIGDWQYGSTSYSAFHKSQPLGYSSSMAFWYYAVEQCGNDVVEKVVSETLKNEKFSNADVAKLLSNYNSTIDWYSLINFFPIEKMYWFYEEISKLMGIK